MLPAEDDHAAEVMKVATRRMRGILSLEGAPIIGGPPDTRTRRVMCVLHDPFERLKRLVATYRATELRPSQPGDPADIRAFLMMLNRRLFDSAWTLRLIEQEAGLCDHNVELRFARYVGQSAGAYRRRHRMELAKRLLRDDGLHSVPIFQIALAVGYTRHDTFTRAFRRYTGMTPDQYRKTT
ncbi:AraC family transcriptional regulator [Rhodothermaceae bacterium RA]|nr:AraC family transcriptional regulator [Rhodothermaceae bacterium RA]